MLAVKTALMVYFTGAIISMFVALLIKIIYKVISARDKSATKSA